MEYLELTKSGHFYGLTLTDIQLGSESVVPVGASAYGTPGSAILDSGTTYTFIPQVLEAPFKEKWLALTGFAYDPDRPLSLSESELNALPVIRFGTALLLAFVLIDL